jgi:hypothetical protein
MPHFFRVLENVKNKEYDILINDKQPLANMPHLPNIKTEISYKKCAIQMHGKWEVLICPYPPPP